MQMGSGTFSDTTGRTAPMPHSSRPGHHGTHRSHGREMARLPRLDFPGIPSTSCNGATTARPVSPATRTTRDFARSSGRPRSNTVAPCMRRNAFGAHDPCITPHPGYLIQAPGRWPIARCSARRPTKARQMNCATTPGRTKPLATIDSGSRSRHWPAGAWRSGREAARGQQQKNEPPPFASPRAGDRSVSFPPEKHTAPASGTWPGTWRCPRRAGSRRR